MKRSLFESLLQEKHSKIFKDDFTDLPWYDNMLANPDYFRDKKGEIFTVEWMTPLAYLKECAKGFKTTVDYLLTKRRDNAKIEKIKKYIQSGHKLPMGVLVYNKNHKFDGQEGIHRAIVAYEFGEKEIPVMIVNKLWR